MGAFFVKMINAIFCHALLLILLFDPRREHSSIPTASRLAVARSVGQGRRFFSAAEGSSLTDASTAASYRDRLFTR
jgi:hypothetical protein